MHLARLGLTEFRCYPTLDLPLDPGPSLFLGPNGAGKTNLLEAVGYLATQTSHRVAVDLPLIRAGADRAVLRGSVATDGRRLLVEVELNPARANRARVAGAPARRAREAIGLLRTVLFAPEDLAVVKGDPAARRRFLDDLLVVRAPRYAAVRADYERVVRQRNALLKTAGFARRTADLAALDVWDDHLVRTGAELLAGRLELVEALRPRLEKAYAGLAAANPGVDVDYQPARPLPNPLPVDRTELAAALAAAVRELRPTEIGRGVGFVGPHRDDLQLSLGGAPTRGYASHGECWSTALALRLASYELLRAEGPEPVLLLDDVFAELDPGRRDRLAELVGGAEQLLVSAADPADLPGRLTGHRFSVTTGRVQRG